LEQGNAFETSRPDPIQFLKMPVCNIKNKQTNLKGEETVQLHAEYG